MALIAGIGAGLSALGALGGAIGGAVNRGNAREEEARMFNDLNSRLTSQYYRDPLTMVGNQSLIKQAKQGHADSLDAIQNQMVAGGATMENALAARQANNESMDKIYTTLLQAEDARRDRIDSQKMGLAQQHSQFVQNSYLQAAQDWNQWGGQMAQAGMSLMNAGLLGDTGLIASNASQQHENWTIPATGSGSQYTGGLRGVYKNYDGQLIKKG